MRYIMIDSRHRRVWNQTVPYRLSEDFFARELRCDIAFSVSLTDELDLWLSDEPKSRSFRFFSDGPEYAGDGILAGRSRVGDIKSLPRFFSFEMVSKWINWPQRQPCDARRPIKLRPTGFPQVGPSDPYHRIAPFGALDTPYVMQMYG